MRNFYSRQKLSSTLWDVQRKIWASSGWRAPTDMVIRNGLPREQLVDMELEGMGRNSRSAKEDCGKDSSSWGTGLEQRCRGCKCGVCLRTQNHISIWWGVSTMQHNSYLRHAWSNITVWSGTLGVEGMCATPPSRQPNKVCQTLKIRHLHLSSQPTTLLSHLPSFPGNSKDRGH